MEGTLLDYFAAKAKRSAAIRKFEEELEAAMGIMRRFEALVANVLGDNAATMAEWTVARSVTRVAARKRSRKPQDATEPAVQPVAA